VRGACLRGLAPKTSEAVKTAGNQPVRRKNWVRTRKVARPRKSAYSLTRGGNSGSNTAVGPLKGPFSVDVPVGVTWLSIDPDDYAPKMVGPYNLTAVYPWVARAGY
jgi:hypothetical protein